MRFFIVFVILFLCGCQNRAACFEHDAAASMQYAANFSIVVIHEGGMLSATDCLLPQEVDIEQRLAVRFIYENAATLGDSVSASVHMLDRTAEINVIGLPPLENAIQEAAFLEAFALTMIQLPAVDRVAYLFDGLTLAELPHGTRCFGDFPIDEMN